MSPDKSCPLQFVPLESYLMDQVDSFQAPIFKTTTLNTADAPGILQFPVGTSSKSASYTFNWAIGAAEHSLPSQMFHLVLLLWMVFLFLIRCTLWGIPFKWYLYLTPISPQDLTHLTRPSLMSHVSFITDKRVLCSVYHSSYVCGYITLLYLVG